MPPGTMALGTLWASTIVLAIAGRPGSLIASVMMKSSASAAVVPSGFVTTRFIVPVPLQFTV
ncbi:MAG TPA: hypothetical protein VEF06_08490 [Bryobacteraceae bacterium]|nr:hypothetical protein [Bryobacteraceae bacterium]